MSTGFVASICRSFMGNGRLKPLTWAILLGTGLQANVSPAASAAPAAEDHTAAPNTPREFYNEGTRQLSAGKLREAESFFESALASQKESLQVPTLYNLGHVRFDQGIEELKKGPSAGKTSGRVRAAADQAAGAIQSVDEALAGDDVQKMVAAYQRGRGARKELRAATEAVRKALEQCGAALTRWQRSSGDFKSAVELKSAETEALENADTVDRCIAALVDSVRELQQCNKGMCEKKDELGQKMKKLKGKIPAPDMPPGAAGEDEDEEDPQLGKQLGQKEGPSKEGKEIMLSPEMAAWLLQGFKLDYDRRLPMMRPAEGKPSESTRPTW
jgi:tetratricopeptide (TPR) repeat protein